MYKIHVSFSVTSQSEAVKLKCSQWISSLSKRDNPTQKYPAKTGFLLDVNTNIKLLNSEKVGEKIPIKC